MKDKNSLRMREQRLRRQRVNRIKKTIIAVMVLGFLAAIALCIGLSVQVIQMNQRIDALARESIAVHENSQPDGYNSVAASSDKIFSYAITEGQRASEEAKEQPDSQDGSQQPGSEPTQEPGEGLQEPEEDNVKKVYLTFDDGPSGNTAKVLDILKEKDVKATFFVIGNEQDYAPDMYRRIVAEGHTLGIHSYTHKYSTIYESLDAFKEDFYHLRDYLTEITGVTPNIMRFPGGSSNSVSNIDMRECIRFLKEEGVTYYDWNVVNGDATKQVYTVDELIDNVIQDVKKYKTSVVLMHDAQAKSTTVEALGPLIDELRDMGCELLPIDENTKVVQHIKADSVD